MREVKTRRNQDRNLDIDPLTYHWFNYMLMTLIHLINRCNWGMRLFVSLRSAMSQTHVFGKILFYKSNMNLPSVSLFASVACELCPVKLDYFDAEGFTFDVLNITDICCY